MEIKEYWNKLKTLEKPIFCLGWLSVLNLSFWLVLIIVNNLSQENKFWNEKSLKVVYVFGWINISLLIFTLFLFAIIQ